MSRSVSVVWCGECVLLAGRALDALVRRLTLGTCVHPERTTRKDARDSECTPSSESSNAVTEDLFNVSMQYVENSHCHGVHECRREDVMQYCCIVQFSLHVGIWCE